MYLILPHRLSVIKHYTHHYENRLNKIPADNNMYISMKVTKHLFPLRIFYTSEVPKCEKSIRTTLSTLKKVLRTDFPHFGTSKAQNGRITRDKICPKIKCLTNIQMLAPKSNVCSKIKFNPKFKFSPKSKKLPKI